jgi:YidC/Oxa1 family membrane protein insertase
MDRNSIIGFSLLAALLVGYIVYNNNVQTKYYEQKRADSIAYAKLHPHPIDTAHKQIAAAAKAIDTLSDSAKRSMPTAYYGTAQTIKLENNKLSLQFSSKGASPMSALVKGFKTYEQAPLYLFNSTANQLSAILPIKNNSVATADLYYTHTITTAPDSSQTIDFTADLGEGKKVDIIYTLPANDYMLRYTIRLTGMPAATLPLHWRTMALHTEKEVGTERMSAQVYYQFKNGDNDYFTITSLKKSLADPVQWLGFRMHYFTTALVADESFNRTDIDATTKLTDSSIVSSNGANIDLPLKAGNEGSLRWYMGPNDYRLLKSYKAGMEEMVPLGFGLFAFVKYINKWALIPIFYFLGDHISNYGVIIMLMTIFIRLILSFFTYKSYLSAAKMRVLKPELDALRAQYGDDQQKFGTEQMKLYRTAGVNPLGGCLPTVFQIPILFAMYYMFPSSIELRQQHFLWSHDLSTYDSVLNLSFNIPFYGDHVSLFTLLMTASSLFLALYNRNMTPQDPNNPMLKWMPFIFPFMLLGVFNKMAAALTFYYFFSNMLSIVQQFIIQKYIIDEKAIHAQIQENKSKPVTASKWQQKLEEIQKAQTEKAKQAKKK